MSGILGLMPGMGKMKNQLAAAGFDDGHLKRQITVIQHEQEVERAAILDAKRRKRIAAGSGTEVSMSTRC